MSETIDVANPVQVLKLERVFKASAARVYEAFTDPAQLREWWGPEGIHIPHAEMEVKEGGAWITTMRNKDGQEYIVSGVYKELEPHRRLAFTWAWINDGVRGHETLVEIDIEPAGDNAWLRLTQSRFETEESRDNHQGGWVSSFNCLEALLSAG